jgi:hypothetical protein
MSHADVASASGIRRRLTLVTYNIHSGVGVDQRYDLARIRRVLNDERPDIAALQELEWRTGRMPNDDQSEILARRERSLVRATSNFVRILDGGDETMFSASFAISLSPQNGSVTSYWITPEVNGRSSCCRRREWWFLLSSCRSASIRADMLDVYISRCYRR